MKKFSLFAILLGFNIALGACSDDDAAPVVKDQIFQLPEKAYVLAEQSGHNQIYPTHNFYFLCAKFMN